MDRETNKGGRAVWDSGGEEYSHGKTVKNKWEAVTGTWMVVGEAAREDQWPLIKDTVNPKTWDKGFKGSKYIDLTFFLPFNLPLTPPIDKPNQEARSSSRARMPPMQPPGAQNKAEKGRVLSLERRMGNSQHNW